jgi:hypothetical protein
MLPGFLAPIGYRDVRSSAVTTKSCVAHRNSHPCTGDGARSRGASCRSGPQQTVADGSPILALTAPESGRTPRAAAEVVRAPHRWHTAKAIRDAGASPSPRAGPSHVCVRGCWVAVSLSRCATAAIGLSTSPGREHRQWGRWARIRHATPGRTSRPQPLMRLRGSSPSRS